MTTCTDSRRDEIIALATGSFVNLQSNSEWFLSCVLLQMMHQYGLVPADISTTEARFKSLLRKHGTALSRARLCQLLSGDGDRVTLSFLQYVMSLCGIAPADIGTTYEELTEIKRRFEAPCP